MQKQFVEEDEYIMVSEKIRKLKASGGKDIANDRVYVMTTHHIYTFKDARKTRHYNIKDVGAIL